MERVTLVKKYRAHLDDGSAVVMLAPKSEDCWYVAILHMTDNGTPDVRWSLERPADAVAEAKVWIEQTLGAIQEFVEEPLSTSSEI